MFSVAILRAVTFFLEYWKGDVSKSIELKSPASEVWFSRAYWLVYVKALVDNKWASSSDGDMYGTFLLKAAADPKILFVNGLTLPVDDVDETVLSSSHSFKSCVWTDLLFRSFTLDSNLLSVAQAVTPTAFPLLSWRKDVKEKPSTSCVHPTVDISNVLDVFRRLEFPTSDSSCDDSSVVTVISESSRARFFDSKTRRPCLMAMSELGGSGVPNKFVFVLSVRQTRRFRTGEW